MTYQAGAPGLPTYSLDNVKRLEKFLIFVTKTGKAVVLEQCAYGMGLEGAK